MKGLMPLRLLLVALLATLGLAPHAQAALQTIEGTPLRVFLNDTSQMQARFVNASFGSTAGFFYSGDVGSSGFAVRFADGPRAGETVGHRGTSFTTVSNGPVTGSGTTADPFMNLTVYKASNPSGGDLLEITQVARYVNGQNRYRMTYLVKNVHDAALRFRAITGGDLYVDGDDSGVGIYIGSVPRFVGGTNTSSRITGGVEEVLSSRLPSDPAPVPVAPWAGYEVNQYSTTYGRWFEPGGFTDYIVGTQVDNGVGVEWEDHLTEGQGLAPDAVARYEALWKVRQPVPLTLSPPRATPEVGTTHTITATFRDAADQPVNGTRVRWTTTGANPGSGNGVTAGSGNVLIQYAGATAGTDTIEAYADVNDNGTREGDEPAQTVTVVWRPETDVDPPSVGTVQRPNGGTLQIDQQTSPDDPVQQWISMPNSQVGEFEDCGGGQGRRVNLPLSVPIVAGSGTIVAGSVRLLLVDPVSDNVQTPLRTIDPASDTPPGGLFAFTIECVLRADLWIRYVLEEPGEPPQEFIIPIGGLVLIDPQGIVHDAQRYDEAIARGLSPAAARAEAAIQGATVRLQRYVDGQFRNVLSGDPGIAPNVNPQVTRANGLYQWDVAEGRYRVVVTATGYPTVTSQAVDIPPPVLDLHIRMTRPGYPPQRGRDPDPGPGVQPPATPAAPAVPGTPAVPARPAARPAATTPPAPRTTLRTRNVTFSLLRTAVVDARRTVVIGTATCRSKKPCRDVLVRLMAAQAKGTGKGGKATAAQRRALLRTLHARTLTVAAGRTVSLTMRVGPAAMAALRGGRPLAAVVAVRERRIKKVPDKTARVQLRLRP